MSNPEEKIASAWIRRLGLRHPIQIEAVLSDFADIYSDSIPGSIDAILIQSNTYKQRAKVIVDSSLSEPRRTFTFAHELGHLLIPWHTGDFLCKPTPNGGNLVDSIVDDMVYRETESEANRFAAEFLMPGTLLRRFLNASDLLPIMNYVLGAKVSLLAAAIQLKNVAPPGHLFIVTDSAHIVFSGRSRDTFISGPSEGGTLDLKYYEEMGAKVQSSPCGVSKKIHWIDASKARMERASTTGEISWRKVLERILDDLDYSPEDQLAKIQSVSGVIGAAISKARRMPNADFFTVVFVRLRDHQNHQDLSSHSLFETFVTLRCQEIESRG